MKFEGIYTPAVTPFASDGKIDCEAFADVLESLVEAEVHGIIIGGSTGEYYAQTAEERRELASLAKQIIKGRTALIIGTGAIVLFARSGSAASSTGPGTEFAAMTAAVLGGISFKGGEGKMWGLVTGVLILGVLGNGMQLIGLNTYAQYIVKGMVLLAAVGFDCIRSGRAASVAQGERECPIPTALTAPRAFMCCPSPKPVTSAISIATCATPSCRRSRRWISTFPTMLRLLAVGRSSFSSTAAPG